MTYQQLLAAAALAGDLPTVTRQDLANDPMLAVRILNDPGAGPNAVSWAISALVADDQLPAHVSALDFTSMSDATQVAFVDGVAERYFHVLGRRLTGAKAIARYVDIALDATLHPPATWIQRLTDLGNLASRNDLAPQVARDLRQRAEELLLGCEPAAVAFCKLLQLAVRNADDATARRIAAALGREALLLAGSLRDSDILATAAAELLIAEHRAGDDVMAELRDLFHYLDDSYDGGPGGPDRLPPGYPDIAAALLDLEAADALPGTGAESRRYFHALLLYYRDEQWWAQTPWKLVDHTLERSRLAKLDPDVARILLARTDIPRAVVHELCRAHGAWAVEFTLAHRTCDTKLVKELVRQDFAHLRLIADPAARLRAFESIHRAALSDTYKLVSLREVIATLDCNPYAETDLLSLPWPALAMLAEVNPAAARVLSGACSDLLRDTAGRLALREALSHAPTTRRLTGEQVLAAARAARG